METDITYGTMEIDSFWYASINNNRIRPGFESRKIARAFSNWLRDGAFKDILGARENILDKAFKQRNEGR